MELILERSYHPSATNGSLSLLDKLICYTIELPWRQNQRKISCIPEGRYQLMVAASRRLGTVLAVEPVPGRTGILMHPANDAVKELKGCIAPVQLLHGPGLGSRSKAALLQVVHLVQSAQKRGEQVVLIIKKQSL